MKQLIYETAIKLVSRPFRFREFLNQTYFVANQSLPIVLVCVSFAAIVTILESSFHMKLVVQNHALVPGFAALLILRELGALITALLVCSRVGAGYASEVGTMKITEQIDALKMLGIDPIEYLVIPRLIACIFGGMILTVLANMMCLLAAAFVTEFYLGSTLSMFLTSMNRFVEFKDLLFAILKGAFFGSVIPIIACYFGFKCTAGADGVGKATTNTVVWASTSIIFLDFILTYSFSYFY